MVYEKLFALQRAHETVEQELCDVRRREFELDRFDIAAAGFHFFTEAGTALEGFNEQRRRKHGGGDRHHNGNAEDALIYDAAGQADATWTLVPKHEWDVAAGAALVKAAGGVYWSPEGSVPQFNAARPKLTGLLAAPGGLEAPIRSFLQSGD